MSIETEINRISTNVSDTLSAISEMGGEVPENATSDDMASGVRSIPVGAKIDDTTPSATTTYSSQKIESELSTLNEAKADKAGWTAGKNLVTDADGNVATEDKPEALKNPNKLILSGAVTAEYDGSAPVSVEIPAGGSGSYTLPVASPTTLGGVQPAAKTDEMTQAVGVDDAGGLWTAPGGSSGGYTFETILDFTFEEEAAYMLYNLPTAKTYKEVYYSILINPAEGKNTVEDAYIQINGYTAYSTNIQAKLTSMCVKTGQTAWSEGLFRFGYVFGLCQRVDKINTSRSFNAETFDVSGPAVDITSIQFLSLRRATNFGVGTRVIVRGVAA